MYATSYRNVSVEAVHSVIGSVRMTAADALRVQRYTSRQAHRSGQESIAVEPTRTGPEMAVQAGREALADVQGPVTMHWHASINDDGFEFWSPQCYVARELQLPPLSLGLRVEAMSNSMVAGMHLAAGMAEHGRQRILLTCGDTFTPPLFCPWQSDTLVYGDGAAAVIVGPGPGGVAELVSAASLVDPELEGLQRGNDAFHPGLLRRPRVELRRRKGEWLAKHGGVDEVDRRVRSAVTSVSKRATYEAGIDVGDVRWVLTPFYGRHLLRRHCLEPLGISEDQTLAQAGLRVGHMGAADQCHGLHHLLSHGLVDSGEYVLVLGIGVGMSFTALVLRVV